MTTQYFLPFYGLFKMHENEELEWQPNTQLERSPEDQFKMNLKNGHFDGKVLIGEYTVENMT